MRIRSFLSLIIALTAPGIGSARAAASKIQVVRGSYGRNCGKPDGNVTAHLARSCNGRATCQYRVNHRVIGDKAPGCAKSYRAEWRCTGNAKIHVTGAPSEASGKTISLKCAGAPTTTVTAKARAGVRRVVSKIKKAYSSVMGKAREKVQGVIGKIAKRIPPGLAKRLPGFIKSRLPGAKAEPAAKGPEKDICWKHSYGRGAGLPITTCDPKDDKNGALCYPKCRAGYKGAGPVCWQHCKPGFHDDGAVCRVNAHIFGKKSYGRGGGYPIWDWKRCESAHGRGRCEKWGAVIYPKCKSGYTAVGCCVCRQLTCPAGYKDDGATCRKDAVIYSKHSYGRGAGTPLKCAPGLEYQHGLCYKPCKRGYWGVGPVCWGNCGNDYPSDCGAACAVTKKSCAIGILKMIAAPFQVVANVASFVATGGAAAAGRMGAQAAIAVAKAVGKAVIKKVAGKVAGALVKKVANQLVARQQSDPKFDAVEFIKSLDPTGIAQVVDAFNKPICKVPGGAAAQPSRAPAKPPPARRAIAKPRAPRRSAPQPSGGMLPRGSYRIECKHGGGQFVTQEGSGYGNGARVLREKAKGWNTQIWNLHPLGGGFYKIEVKHGGNRFLTQSGAGYGNGAPVLVERWKGWNTQIWKLHPLGGGFYKIEIKHGGNRFLTAEGSGYRSGTRILVERWKGWNTQIWRIRK